MVNNVVYLLYLNLILDLVLMGAQVTCEEYMCSLLELYLPHYQKWKL